jgi:hypothetical protein
MPQFRITAEFSADIRDLFGKPRDFQEKISFPKKLNAHKSIFSDLFDGSDASAATAFSDFISTLNADLLSLTSKLSLWDRPPGKITGPACPLPPFEFAVFDSLSDRSP